MPALLFQNIVFGPIRSRRLGRSLGVNLLPSNGKWCNFNCIYCECGWNSASTAKTVLPVRQEVAVALERRLHELRAENALPDAVTFSGNGEPTLHPQFANIIDDVVFLRSKYAPQTRICVLTNAATIGKTNVRNALKKIDIAMLKLDAGNGAMLRLINQPQGNIDVENLTAAMQIFGEGLVVQTMFLQGEVDGRQVDNSQPAEVETWLQCLQTLRPSEVMIYTLDRATPAECLQKISAQRLNEIAGQVGLLGIKASVY